MRSMPSTMNRVACTSRDVDGQALFRLFVVARDLRFRLLRGGLRRRSRLVLESVR